ncbi:CBASS cGAMP synthase [Metapseudomonas furukawaii]|uniref:Cyclic GMP-AMP synthase n=1 Tax=Metapseudomonas furukawaii TaxID=1149133 RepID=A0AAD1BWS3_METFU|nr:hypothetical protein [Pseudomonas furukawaii]BAU73081.1 hypothetical protein KF707C_13930 [Pseudomonas furukawaii]
MLNLSALFYTKLDQPNFLAELDLTEGEKTYISDAKNEIRAALRERLKASIADVLAQNGLEAVSVEPKFYIQGSWAYRTLNRPCTTPPQQSDLDDGVYLPMSIMKEHRRPSVASALFFEATEAALKPLAADKKWTLSAKPTCIRLEISPFAHIDIPLYAIPDDEFMLLKAANESFEGRVFNAATDSAKDHWAALPSDHVLLAHREENWIKSDPRAMKDWFVQEIADRGEQLRRVVRYLKAFRDKVWTKGGPSSILLMAATAPIFEKRDKRDDLALKDVLEKLPNVLREGVLSPIDSEVYLTASLAAEEIEEIARQFEAFHNHLSGAIFGTDKQQACTWVRSMLGDRFPNRADLVLVSTVAAAVQAVPAEAGPRELVKTTKAG